MQLNLELTSEDGSDVSLDRGLASPMGGKHQRDLSLSAKWANNKALALEYLKRQREAILWIENVLDRKLETRDLFEALRSGIVLREVMAKLYPAPSECRSPISRKYSMRMAPWKERENISIFLKHCKALGMDDLFLFCTDDLYEGTNMVQVLFSVQHFMAFSREKSSYLFKPIAHESVVFSNQEVEMALSNIEKAGVEANAFLTPPSASPSPAKPPLEADHSPASDEELATAPGSDCNSEKRDDQQEFEPAELDGDVDGDDHDDGGNEDEDPRTFEEAAALAALEMELPYGESNITDDEEERELNEYEQQPVFQEAEHTDEEAESMLPPLETDDEHTVAALALNEEEAAMEALALAAMQIDESIMLLEIVDQMVDRIEEGTKLENPATNVEEFLTSEDIEVIRIDSSELSDHTDKHETYTGDSLTPTTVDNASVAADAAARPNRFSRAARAAKHASKAAKKAAKKGQDSTDEPLDEEAMSRCTCGSKCTIM